MSSSTAPSTPENALAVSNAGLRRSFTVPAKLPKPRAASTTSAELAEGIETLFTHTFAKIVSFSTSSGITRATSSSSRVSVDLDMDTPGSMPWSSYTERTLAAGPVRIYRVISSNVSFLNSGRLLHTIFPKSQCWCVDGECKFVLRIRQDSYYRIELPWDTEEDKEKVEELKVVLDKVLQYEKTTCPFQRGFHVDLPELPQTPVRKRPRKPPEKAKRWIPTDRDWVPEDSSKVALDGSDTSSVSIYEDDDRESIMTSSTLEEHVERPEAPETNKEASPQYSGVLQRAKSFTASRSITAPQLAYRPPWSLPTETVKSDREPTGTATETVSLSSSKESFYSLEKTPSRSPTPPFVDATSLKEENPWAHNEDENGKDTEENGETVWARGRHRRQTSEITVTAHSRDASEENLPVLPTGHGHVGRSLSAPSTPPLMSDSDDSFEPPLLDVPTPPNTIRLRKLTGASQRRAFSPMPRPSNLFSPPLQAPRKQLTAALVQKTCALLLGPPAHLVALMLRIAAKVANGAFGFNTYRIPRDGERIPCSWESSGDEDEWNEDDYGIPLGSLEASALRGRDLGQAWEVD